MQDFLNVWSNFLWFIYHFFSMSLLLRTLFSPWRRLDERSKSGFHLEAFLEKLVSNTVVRAIGTGARLFVIVSGCIIYLAGLVLGFIFFLIWCLLPVAVIGLVVIGFRLILFT